MPGDDRQHSRLASNITLKWVEDRAVLVSNLNKLLDFTEPVAVHRDCVLLHREDRRHRVAHKRKPWYRHCRNRGRI